MNAFSCLLETSCHVFPSHRRWCCRQCLSAACKECICFRIVYEKADNNTMISRVSIFWAFGLACLLLNCTAALSVSPDWDPASLQDCSVNRREVIDHMFDMFDRNGTQSVADSMVYCVFNAPGVFSDSQRELVEGGPDAIVLYCDGDSNGFIEYSEVLHTHTCVGNCPTAQTLGMAVDIIEINRDSWEPLCF